MRPTTTLECLLTVLLFLPIVSAQFGNFFGGGDPFGRQQQQRQPAGGAGMWASTAEQISCNQYMCPTTLDCVAKPVDCPCPSPEDIKCVIPDELSHGDGTVVCVRGELGCRALEKKLKP
ncbi:Long chronological lifespan protein 2 [Tulasnella sp. JGI-2019a]|nr:Long chronological lifespan protein 2 [Tulasnella sp. JGI-2019a]KAG9015424.1 Long chronological lifespan protein 2 [Tulasnella sp. JGI-2019a]KAG9037668.1 Long chronological lifespan protein 2 [Tulasnella sp. JGI-2019a]